MTSISGVKSPQPPLVKSEDLKVPASVPSKNPTRLNPSEPSLWDAYESIASDSKDFTFSTDKKSGPIVVTFPGGTTSPTALLKNTNFSKIPSDVLHPILGGILSSGGWDKQFAYYIPPAKISKFTTNPFQKFTSSPFLTTARTKERVDEKLEGTLGYQARLLHQYTRDTFLFLNAFLRSRSEASNCLGQKFVYQIDNKVTEQLLLMTFAMADGISKSTTRSETEYYIKLANLPSFVLDGIKPGITYRDAFFGAGDKLARDYLGVANSLWVIKDPYQSKSITHMVPVSAYPHEKETLFAPNTPMKILSVGPFKEWSSKTPDYEKILDSKGLPEKSLEKLTVIEVELEK